MTGTKRHENPYIAGKALTGARGFFGREDVFRAVKEVLESPDQKALVLHGQRRIGKTSILLQLEQGLSEEGYSPVYFDLMDKAKNPLNQVVYDLACGISQMLQAERPTRNRFDGDGQYLYERYIPELQESRPGTRLVLMFDEFDVMDALTEKQLGPMAAAKAFFPYLRQWMSRSDSVQFVFVVGRRPEDLSTDFLATFKAARSKQVSVLSPKAARELIRSAEREGSLKFEFKALEAVLEQTSGHPFLTQLLCHVLWNEAWVREPSTIPRVTAKDVMGAVPLTLEAGSGQLQWIWDGLPPAERLIMASIAAASQRVVTSERMMQLLLESGIRVIVRELEVAPQTLVRWGLLREVDGGYTFSVELIRSWVAEIYPLAVVKDEIDRVEPLADGLYRVAQMFYRQQDRDLENAKDQLTRALSINPNHFQARLLLGQILQEEGQLESAVWEFERAYEYDEEGARTSLVRALLVHAEDLERKDDEDSALSQYQRVIEVSPKDRVAAERMDSIRTKHRALEAKDLEAEGKWEAALEIYTQLAKSHSNVSHWSNAVERVTEVVVVAKAAKAARFEKVGKWKEALSIYHALSEQQPDTTDWSESVERVSNAIVRAEADRAYELEKAGSWFMALMLYEKLSQEQPSNSEWAEACDRAEVMWTGEESRRAEELKERGGWAEALTVYRGLASRQPHELSWQKQIQTAENEVVLAQRFDEGLAAIKQERWEDAQRVFADLIFERPDYERKRGTTAASELSNAIHGAAHVEVVVKHSSEQYATIDLDNASDIREVGRLRQRGVNSLAFSPCGRWLAIGGNQVLCAFEIDSWQRTDLGGKISSRQVVFSPDGSTLASVHERAVQLWDAATWKLLKTLESEAKFTRVAFQPKSTTLATAVDDSSILWWDTETGVLCNTRREGTRALRKPEEPCALVYSPDGQKLAILTRKTGYHPPYCISVRSVPSWKRLLRIIEVGENSPYLAFSPDGQWLTNGSLVWDAHSGKQTAALGSYKRRSQSVVDRLGGSIWRGSPYEVGALSLGTNGDPIVVGWQESYRSRVQLRLCFLGEESKFRHFGLAEHTDHVTAVACSPGGKLIASASADGTIRFWGVRHE